MYCKKPPINCKDMGREGQKRQKTEGKKRKINYRFHFHFYLRICCYFHSCVEN